MIPRLLSHVIIIGCAVAGCISSSFASDAAPKPAKKPNLIFVLTDDLGFGDVSTFGQLKFATPNLDRMAAEGTKFTNFYCGTSVCGPSRCSLFTGLHTGHTTVRGNASGDRARAAAISSKDITIGRVMKDAGYTTGIIGKWGLGNFGDTAEGLPNRHGFDYFYGYLDHWHAHNSYPSYLWRNEEKVLLRNVVPNEEPSGAGVSTVCVDYSNDLFADEALSFIRKNSDKPFCLFFTPTIPHANNERQPEGIEVPDLGQYADKDWPGPQKAHAAVVTRFDSYMGRLFALLKELNIDENTLVVFTSDNGPHRESGGNPDFFKSSGIFSGIKRTMNEGGLRVSTIARWPGKIAAGAHCDTPGFFADIVPTFASLGGSKLSIPSDGINLSPDLLGQKNPAAKDRVLYWELFERGLFRCAVRQGIWKGIRQAPDAAVELYNLETDPAEKNDLAAKLPEIAAKLGKLMDEAHKDTSYWVKPAVNPIDTE